MIFVNPLAFVVESISPAMVFDVASVFEGVTHYKALRLIYIRKCVIPKSSTFTVCSTIIINRNARVYVRYITGLTNWLALMYDLINYLFYAKQIARQKKKPRIVGQVVFYAICSVSNKKLLSTLINLA